MPLVEASSQIALKSILFPTDFSERSAVGLPYAAAIARRYNAKLHVAHVVSPETPISMPVEGPPVSAWSMAEQEVAILERSDLLAACQYDTVVEQGELWEVLSEIIKKYEVDLIVMVTHGRGGFKRLILGSAAEEIVREASCPVLTIGPEVPSRVDSKRNLRQVLYTTDFRPGSLASLMYAVFFAEENGARLTLVHVAEPPSTAGSDDAERQRALHRLQQMMPAENYLVWQPKYLIESGPAGSTVLRLAKEEHADLIVMGARETPRHWIPSHFTWTTLHQILCDAPCPVLTVRG